MKGKRAWALLLYMLLMLALVSCGGGEVAAPVDPEPVLPLTGEKILTCGYCRERKESYSYSMSFSQDASPVNGESANTTHQYRRWFYRLYVCIRSAYGFFSV